MGAPLLQPPAPLSVIGSGLSVPVDVPARNWILLIAE